MQQNIETVRLYATKTFTVDRSPQNETACLTRLRESTDSTTVSSITFVGEDADLFLLGLTEAMLELPESQIEDRYLSHYSPIMKDHLLH